MAKIWCYRKRQYKPMYYAVYTKGHKDKTEFLGSNRTNAIRLATKIAEKEETGVLIVNTSGSIVKC